MTLEEQGSVSGGGPSVSAGTNGACIIAAQRILYAYVRLHETLNIEHGAVSADMAAELSEAYTYLAMAYQDLTGQTIGLAFLAMVNHQNEASC